MAAFGDIICAPATSVGAGAVSVIRVSGPLSLELADKVITFRKTNATSAKGYSLKFGSITDESGALVDEVLVSIFRAPHSYTGEDGVEISCHASTYIVSRILALLVDAGARMAGPGEFTQRAFVNGKMDLAQAEAVADVIAASSEAMHRVAMNQLKGGYSAELEIVRKQMIELTALMELELDFSEEEVEFADRSTLGVLLQEAIRKVATLSSSFKTGNALRNGVPVAIAGAVNSGKSTLLNALLGEDRAIVSDVPGTTRDTVEELLNIAGITFRFIDTAGLRESDDVVEKKGIQRSILSVRKADVVIGVVDGTLPLEEQAEAAAGIRSLCTEGQELIIVKNKKDRAEFNSPGTGFSDEALEISAQKSVGIDALKERLAATQEGRFNAAGTTLVTNLRHYEALRRALNSLQEIRKGLDSNIPTDLLAEQMRLAIDEIGSVTGSISTDDVLGEIFGRFCIGK